MAAKCRLERGGERRAFFTLLSVGGSFVNADVKLRLKPA